MLRYPYEKLTTEEKRFIHYLHKDPIATCDTLFREDYYRSAKKLTKGKRNKAFIYLMLFLTVLDVLILIFQMRDITGIFIYTILILMSILLSFSIYKLGKHEFSKENPILQKEVYTHNIRLIERVLKRNREPLEISIIEETPKYFKIKSSILNNKVQKIYKRARDESSWRVFKDGEFYYIYYRFNILRLGHIQIRNENYKELDSEFLDMRRIEYGTEEITKEAYEKLIEESKYKEWYIREYIIYTLTLGFLFFPFLILTFYSLIYLLITSV